MRFIDQIRISISNLWRRKLRTGLTVLGVLIGTVAIVVMMSIGIAQQEYMQEMIGSSRDLLEIEIYSMGGYDPSGDVPDGVKLLDDDALKELAGIDHVEYVSPILTTYARLQSGPYETYANIMAFSRQYIDDLKWDYSKGAFPAVEDYVEGNLPLAIGHQVNYQFYNPNSSSNFYGGWYPGMEGEEAEPDVDMYANPVFAIFDSNFGDYNPDNPPPPPKKYMMQADAIIDPGPTGWSEFSYEIYTDIEPLKDFLNMVYKGKAWPNQPATKSGRSIGKIVYDGFRVKSDSIDHTIEIAQTVKDMGYQSHTMAEYVEDMREQSARTQIILGGIGGISLLVAAIGIANTMMMSIYERTKEIGIYKVLGCNLRTIRNLFLLESGLIGFIGGVFGLGLSYAISYIINRASSAGGSVGGMMYVEQGQKISLIPPWLALAALVFGVIIGMLAGLMPAQRAMKLSPLEAIRTE